jgi:single-strand DNA-binding protein
MATNFNLNKVILGGRLTSDVEVKQTQSGVAVCSFSLAVNRRYSKEGQQETDFINCTAWRNTAEFIGKYFGKGSAICVTGSIQVRSWQDQNGQKRYATDVVVDEAMFVDGKNDAQGAGTAAAAPYIPEAYTAPQSAKFEGVDTDSDLPF